MACGSAPGFKLFGKLILMEEHNRQPIKGEEEEEAKEEEAKALEKVAVAVVCPRCKSKETKFCYFNNYNINQPRHFCRACHRYWTAGGTLRNVPVGAGRRRARPASRLLDYQYSQCIDEAELERWTLHPDPRAKRHGHGHGGGLFTQGFR